MFKSSELLTHRMTFLFWLGVVMLAAALFAVQAFDLPPLFQVALYKGFLLFAGAHAGYWIDRGLFPYARPDKVSGALYSLDAVLTAQEQAALSSLFALCMLRRALIVFGAMVCVAFGA